MLIEGPAAVVSGPPAVLLSLLLRSPNVRTVVEGLPPWLRPYRAEIARVVEELHRVAASTALEREDAEPVSATAADSGTCTVSEAADRLRLSVRRTQELAAAGLLGGRRVGRTWQLDSAAVRVVAAERARAS